MITQQSIYAGVGGNLLLVSGILLSENPLFHGKVTKVNYITLKEWEEEEEMEAAAIRQVVGMQHLRIKGDFKKEKSAWQRLNFLGSRSPED